MISFFENKENTLKVHDKNYDLSVNQRNIVLSVQIPHFKCYNLNFVTHQDLDELQRKFQIQFCCISRDHF